MLSGRRAFAEEMPISTIAAVLHKEPRALRELVPDPPPELDALVNRCLAKSPADRFSTMGAVLLALDEAARGLKAAAAVFDRGAAVQQPQRGQG